MALGLSKPTGDNDFLPIFKFNAVSGDAVISKSVKGADGIYEKQENDVSFPSKFIFDFENIEVGWMHFSATGPSFDMVPLGKPLPPKPSDQHKQGFRLKLFSKAHGLVVFTNSSGTVKDVMNTLHDSYEVEKLKHTGKVPVVEIKGTKKVSVKTKEGAKNYKAPDWSITSWVARPPEMEAATKVAASTPEPIVEESDEF